jgi:hypothetical protein
VFAAHALSLSGGMEAATAFERVSRPVIGDTCPLGRRDDYAAAPPSALRRRGNRKSLSSLNCHAFACEKLNAQFETEGLKSFFTRFGIHVGEAVVGILDLRSA